MEGFLVLMLVLVAIFIGWRISRIVGNNIPKEAQVRSDTQEFFKSIENETGFRDYVYCLDNTGYAISIEKESILLKNGDIQKIYKRENLRSIEAVPCQWETTKLYGKHDIATAMSVAGDNKIAKKRAYENSGLFIKVADVKYPTWQIKTCSQSHLDEIYETVLEFMEGKLNK